MAFMPTIAPNIPIIIGLSNGEAIRNDIVTRVRDNAPQRLFRKET